MLYFSTGVADEFGLSISSYREKSAFKLSSNLWLT